jgi:dCTP deaminase
MIVNGQALWKAQPFEEMLSEKRREHGVSYGLAEAGYDIRIKQEVFFSGNGPYKVATVTVDGLTETGNFTIASAIEKFTMPTDLVGVVHDKSTWARKGLSVFNTVIEPGWEGYLTLELVYHGQDPLHIPAGAGIAQVLFSRVENPAQYSGKYQGQEDKPVAAKFE